MFHCVFQIILISLSAPLSGHFTCKKQHNILHKWRHRQVFPMSLGWLIFLHAVLHNAFTNNTSPFSQNGYSPYAFLPAVEQFLWLQCLNVVSIALFTAVHRFHFHTHWYFIPCSVPENDADKSKLVRVVRHVEIDNASHPFPISHTAHTPSPPISALIISYTLIFA